MLVEDMGVCDYFEHRIKRTMTLFHQQTALMRLHESNSQKSNDLHSHRFELVL